MSTFNMQNIRDELCHFLRYSDILTVAIRGVTRTSAEGYTVGVGGETTHTFAHTPIRDFKTLTVNGTSKYFLRDYTFNGATGILTWNSGLIQGDVVAVTYDYTTSINPATNEAYADRIYPDMPRESGPLTSFPKVGIEITSTTTEPFGIGGTTHISDILVTIIVWSPANKDTSIANYGGLTDLEGTIDLIRDAIRTNAKSFYTFTWIYPKGRGPLTRSTNNKIMQMSADYLIRFKVE